MNIGDKIKKRRLELGYSQRYLAEKMRYSNHSTIVKIEANKVDLPHSKIVQFAEILNIPLTDLIASDNPYPTNKEIFSNNLNYYINLHNLTQRELAEIVNVSTATMNEWSKGKKYPRIDKIEKLAEYFDISKSDLIENKTNNNIISNTDINLIIHRLKSNSNFLDIVHIINELNDDQLKHLKTTIDLILNK